MDLLNFDNSNENDTLIGIDYPPKKYAKINGVTKFNPEYKRWKEAQDGKPVTTVNYPNQTSPVVVNKEGHEKLCAASVAAGGSEVLSSKSTNATIEMMQEPEISLDAGMQPATMVDQLGSILNKYEVPMGLMNKLMMLTEFQALEFLVDDSGSMTLEADSTAPKQQILKNLANNTPPSHDRDYVRCDKPVGIMYTGITVGDILYIRPQTLVYTWAFCCSLGSYMTVGRMKQFWSPRPIILLASLAMPSAAADEDETEEDDDGIMTYIIKDQVEDQVEDPQVEDAQVEDGLRVPFSFWQTFIMILMIGVVRAIFVAVKNHRESIACIDNILRDSVATVKQCAGDAVRHLAAAVKFVAKCANGIVRHLMYLCPNNRNGLPAQHNRTGGSVPTQLLGGSIDDLSTISGDYWSTYSNPPTPLPEHTE